MRRRFRKDCEELLLLLAYHIVQRASRIDARLKPLAAEFDRLRETL